MDYDKFIEEKGLLVNGFINDSYGDFGDTQGIILSIPVSDKYSTVLYSFDRIELCKAMLRTIYIEYKNNTGFNGDADFIYDFAEDFISQPEKESFVDITNKNMACKDIEKYTYCIQEIPTYLNQLFCIFRFTSG